jgi:hypothetical protein
LAKSDRSVFVIQSSTQRPKNDSNRVQRPAATLISNKGELVIVGRWTIRKRLPKTHKTTLRKSLNFRSSVSGESAIFYLSPIWLEFSYDKACRKSGDMFACRAIRFVTFQPEDSMKATPSLIDLTAQSFW